MESKYTIIRRRWSRNLLEQKICPLALPKYLRSSTIHLWSFPTHKPIKNRGNATVHRWYGKFTNGRRPWFWKQSFKKICLSWTSIPAIDFKIFDVVAQTPERWWVTTGFTIPRWGRRETRPCGSGWRRVPPTTASSRARGRIVRAKGS